ncbi:fibronectin type III domain-containing protein [uncultured Aquimarina sp.]|uniref:fibronectin type III domain-containing protein n=1 Tax=uncultured Aquimarina sp. TaxID=575652 RepID=UPI00261637E5|nr:fibronectin type III domain-containing protein [uncultured Aquimarina sp.]
MSKITLTYCFYVFFLLSFPAKVFSQELWWEISTNQYSKSKLDIDNETLVFEINSDRIEDVIKRTSFRFSKNNQKHIINFPVEANKIKSFEVFRTEVLHPYLAVKYPNISSFVGVAIDNPKEIIRFSYSPGVGLQGNIVRPGKKTLIIKPVNKKVHVLFSSGQEKIESTFNCETDGLLSEKLNDKNALHSKNANDGNLRRYRLALSVTGEYSQFFLDGTEVSDLERKTKVMAAMVASINRVNGIFERDFGVTLQIIPENDSLIFLDAANDPYLSGNSLNNELQNTLDTDPNVGSARYDVGHLFHFENAIYGNAGCIACVCTDGSKGSAFTVHSDPSSDNFNLIVAHEFGHQFGGFHVQSSPNCRSGFNSEVEPGSGSTIMGYAGICSPNVQNQPDDYFNYVDIRDVAIWTIDNSDCAEIITTGNTAPDADAGNDYTIPKSTPFVLEGTATDIDGDTGLTYCWEQNNPEDPFSSNTPQPNWVNGPLFRSLLPKDEGKRYFPKLDDVLTGNITPTWEVLPAVARTMRFELTVRDNVLQGGQSNTDGVLLTVADNSGPFIVTSQNTEELWNVGEEVTVSWDVANTDQAPVSANTVDILLSVDGGYTYPYVIQDDITNDGSETFVLPNVDSSTSARIMIKASNNIFFAVNNTDFEVQSSEFAINTTESTVSVCKPENAIYNLEYRTFLDFSEEVVLSAENLPVGLNATFEPSTIIGNQLEGIPIQLTISGTENLVVGAYDFSIKGSSVSGSEKIVNLTLLVFNDEINTPTLISPSDNEIGFELNQSFTWSEDTNAEAYEIQIATDGGFSTVIESKIVSENNYTPENLEYSTSYFWRVQNINPCGPNVFSSINTFVTQCADPEEFRYIAIGPSFVNLGWVDDNSLTWDIEYGPSGFILGDGISVEATSNPFEINNLNSLFDYDFYIRSTCFDGSTGRWIGPISASTTEDFCSGDRFYDSGGETGNYSNNENITTVISPSTAQDRVRVNFESFLLESCCDALSVYDGTDTSAPLIGVFSSVSPGMILSTNESGALTFVFRSDGSVTAQGWEAQVICEPKPNCDKPENFGVNNIDATSAILSWDTDNESSSWDLEYGLSGFDEGTGTIVNSTETSFTINGLDPITSYDVYIRGNCTAGGVSDIEGPLTFTTLCEVISAPFIESFEEFTTPVCWSEEVAGSWSYNLFANNDASQAGDRNILRNTNYAWVDGSFPNGENAVSILNTPLIDISTLTEPSIQFSVFSKNTIDNTYNTLVAEFYDGMNWNIILEVQENTGGWRDIAINLENYTISGPIQVRFTVTKNSPGNPEYNDILIDEIKVDEMPSCLNPYRLEVSNIKGRSVDISWISSGNESNWELQYGLQGFTPATAINEIVTSNPYEISGLEPTTTYELYLRAVCGIGDNSEFIGPITFTTDCDPFEVPFVESFFNFSRPECWKEGTDNSWSYGIIYDFNLDINIPDRTSGENTNYTWKYNSFNNSQTPSYLFTPFIDVSSLSIPSVQFSLYSNLITNENYNTLTVEFFDGVNWNLLLTFAESTEAWRDYYFDLSSYTISDNIKIRFGIVDNQNSSEFNYILIDDVKVGELPSCFNPNSLSVSEISIDSATINWAAAADESNWQIQFGEKDFVIGEGTLVDTVNTTEIINNLNSGTEYDVYVRSNCDTDGFSEWIGPLSFSTIPDYCNGDLFYDSGGSNGNYSNNENETILIAPQDTGDRVRVIFDLFSLESCCDNLSVYDGPDSSSPLIGVFNNNSPGEIVSTHESGALTFVFRSDGSVTRTGWEARVFCEPKPNCSAPINPVTTFILANDVELFWTSSGLDANWELEYGVTGFDQGSGTIINTTDNPYRITNLTADTFYDVYIKTICDDGGFSDVVGPITFKTEVSCPAPSGFVVNSVTGQSANISWDLTGGNEQFWEIEYGVSGFIQGNGTVVPSEVNTLDILDLAPTTNYDIYIRSNCGIDEASIWAGPFSFRTSCDPISNETNQFVQNGSFECGDLGSWRSIGTGINASCQYDFTVLENSFNVCVIVPNISPTDGQYAAFTSFDGNAGDVYILEQTIVLPSNLSSATSLIASFDFVVEYSITNTAATAERTLEVDMFDTSNNLITTIDRQSFGMNPTVGNINTSISKDILLDLLSYEGQEVILRFTANIPDTFTGPSKALIDNVSLIAENSLSVEETELLGDDLVISPNPNNGNFGIFYSGSNTLKEIQVFDLTGKLIFDEDLSQFNKEKLITLNNPEAGMYLIKITSDKKAITKTIIIQ